MNRRRIVRRRFDERMDRLQGSVDLFDDKIEKLRDQASLVADHAREGLERGRTAVVTLEQNLVRSVRANPTFFIAAGLALIGLIVAKMFVDRSKNRRW